jgi:serpin B
MMRRLLGSALALAFCVSAGASAAPAPTASKLAQSYAQFGFDLLRELRSERAGGNVFISPTSIAVALAMVANGANGATRSAILSAIHVNGLPIGSVNDANRALASQIAGTTAVRLTIANALWLQTGFAVRPQFVGTMRGRYTAQVRNLDFRSPRAVDTVNAWAKQHTDGMIPKVLDSIDPSTLLMLANAIAFKGKWSTPFSVSATTAHAFTTGAGKSTSVEMMSHSDRYAYASNGGTQMIKLPYADGSFAMYVILPKDSTALDTLVRGLTASSFDLLTGSLITQKGTIELPRFQISYGTKLNRALAKLGMGIAFTRAADFDNMHVPPPPIAIGEVDHVTYLQVNEAGTKAAAVTTIGMHATAIQVEPPPFTMVVDHPFLLAIRDERSQQLLFLGTIANP